MSAQLIFDTAPLGAIIRYSDGTPRPPDRHRRKLQAWERHNNTGRLVKKQTATVVGRTAISPSFTLHEGDFGSKAVIVLRLFFPDVLNRQHSRVLGCRAPRRMLDPRARSSG